MSEIKSLDGYSFVDEQARNNITELSENKADKTEIPAPYTLPTASAEVKGGVMVGEGLQMNGEALEVVPEGEYELIEDFFVGCELLTDKPEDWDTNWQAYMYKADTGILASLSTHSAAPNWKAGYYYKQTGDGGISELERTAEADGTPYNFSAIKILIKAANTQEAGHYYFHLYDTSNAKLLSCTCRCLRPNQESTVYTSTAACVMQPVFGGIYEVYLLSGGQGDYPEIIKPANLIGEIISADRKIARVVLSLLNVDEIAVGSSIAIWGVRA